MVAISTETKALLVKIGKKRDRYRIWTIQRCNQHQQASSHLKRLISRVRQPIEGVFHEIQNTGRNPERLLNKTVGGFATHIAAKITSHSLRLLLRPKI